MIRQLALERPAATGPSTDGSATGLVAAAAAVRGAVVAASGLLLTAGLALVLWAVTPASGDDVASALQGGVAAFAAANLMPVVIGGVTFTLPPLLLTAVIAGLFFSTARRGRLMPVGRYQETVCVLLTAAVYGLIASITTRGFGPAGAVPAGWVWTAAALALVATSAGMLRRGSAWHDWWKGAAAAWLRLGVRGAWLGLWMMIAGGGVALSVGLIAHFGSGIAIGALAAPSWTDGLGLAMLGVAYVPNAVVAGVGYVSGVGFEIGPGTYSPLATATVDLPGVPLLAAAPDQVGRSWIGLAFLLVPAVAGYLIARPVIKSLATRSERLLAAGLAATLAGALVAAAAAIARGGIGDGRWSTIGAPPLLVGGAVAAEIGIVALAYAALAGGRAVPWRLSPARSATPRRVSPAATVSDDAEIEDDLLTAATIDDEVQVKDVTADQALPEDGLPDDGVPGDGVPDDGVADAVVPGDDVSDVAAPDDALPDDALPGNAAPDAPLPDALPQEPEGATDRRP